MQEFGDLVKIVGFGGACFIFYLLKIGPMLDRLKEEIMCSLRQIDMTLLRGQRIELLRMTKKLVGTPELHQAAIDMIAETDAQMERRKAEEAKSKT